MGNRVASLVIGVALGIVPTTSAFAQAQNTPNGTFVQNVAAPTPFPDASGADVDPNIRHLVAIKQQILTNGYGTLLDDLQKQYGQRPMRTIGYLPNLGGEVGRAIFAGAANTGTSPTLLSVAIFQEGFNLFLDKNQVGLFDPKHLPVDGFSDIGADSFYGRIPELKRRGYLPKNYDGVTPKTAFGCTKAGKVQGKLMCLAQGDSDYWMNEHGDRFRAYDFKSMKDAATAVGAMLHYENDRFLADAKSLGIDTSKMSEADRDAWTYLYYNTGNGKALLQKYDGQFPTRSARGQVGTINSNPLFNAQRVAASVAMYQHLHVFDGINVARYADSRGVAGTSKPTGNEGFHH